MVPTMHDPSADVFIGVGSSIEPMKNVPRAVALLTGRVRVVAASRFYLTEPLGRPADPPFANGVLRIWTTLPTRRLKLEVLRPTESALGRARRGDPWGPRTIDLDILLHGAEVSSAPDLVLPAPEISERPFVAAALVELEPGLALPGTGELLSALVDEDARRELVEIPRLTAAVRDILRGTRPGT